MYHSKLNRPDRRKTEIGNKMLSLLRNLSFVTLFVMLPWQLIGQALPSPKEQNSEQCKEFITTLGNNIINILVNKQKPLQDRKEQFRQVLRNYFDIPEIGKFVLARYWKRATESEQVEYINLFENAIVENYAAQFDNYQNEILEVRQVRQTPDGGVIVMSEIKRLAGSPPLKVDWKIFNTKQGLRVYDIFVNGVSMSITQRSEYAAIMNQSGGRIEDLLNVMRQGKTPSINHS